MPAKNIVISAPQSVAASAGVKLDPTFSNGNSYNVQFRFGGTATCQVQISYDGSTWTSIGSAASSNSIQSLNLGASWIRVNVTAWTSGTVEVIIHNRSPAKVYA